MITFLLLSSIIFGVNAYDFHYKTRPHAVKEDARLKAKGINLPGYNH